MPNVNEFLNYTDWFEAILHDIHSHTWFQLKSSSSALTSTSRGTRPGSPLADIGFNVLMSKILHQLQAEKNTIEAYRRGQEAMIEACHTTCGLGTASPAELLEVMREVAICTHTAFMKHGMTLDLDAGKTEAVIMFRAPGCNVWRSRTFDTHDQPRLVASSATHVLSVRIVSRYRHLGARSGMNADNPSTCSSSPSFC